MASPLLTLDNPLFVTYLFYGGVLALKLLAMSPLTGRQRFRKNIFANAEDAKSRPNSKVKLDDPDVERVRRAHLNDLENIPVFFIVGLLYILTDPSVWLAKMLIRSFVVARITHTVVYVSEVPQPARALSFAVGFIITIYMAVNVVLTSVSGM